MARTTLIIGGAGAQGSVVARILAVEGGYSVKVLTRNVESKQAKELAKVHGIALIQGDSLNEADLASALSGVDSVYANTNGFAIGEKAEVYWGIRTYEIARRVGVKHFVWAGLEYNGPKTNFDEKYHVGHYEGKGRVTGKRFQLRTT
jgi:uncharacterized protein YbjT (DUF2867 family)